MCGWRGYRWPSPVTHRNVYITEKEMIPDIQEYTRRMLSCTDPDEVVRIWNEYGRSHTEEQVVALHKISGVADKLLWAVRNDDVSKRGR